MYIMRCIIGKHGAKYSKYKELISQHLCRNTVINQIFKKTIHIDKFFDKKIYMRLFFRDQIYDIYTIVVESIDA